MGIPTYFSYIIRNHMKVLKSFLKFRENTNVDNLYMDSNSVIYDCLRDLEKKSELKPVLADNYPIISHAVCVRIEKYINDIGPSDTVYLAFDGVAPLAKRQQQMSRRCKTVLMEKLFGKSLFSTVNITPGTDFMNYFSKYVVDYFTSDQLKLPCANIVVSSPNEPGEGEHEIFKCIRDSPERHLKSNTIIYGLDADLLMLSIFHYDKANLFVYREAPEFAKSLNADLNAGEGYVLNISELCVSICIEIGFAHDLKNITRRVNDYVVMCFLLGNDFLPHNPLINIRTSGMARLINAYKQCAEKEGFFLIDSQEKIWCGMREIMLRLEGSEEGSVMDGKKRVGYRSKGVGEREKLEEMVMIMREKEEYVNFEERGWRERMEKIEGMHKKKDEERIGWIEGMQRVYYYYKRGLNVVKRVKERKTASQIREEKFVNIDLQEESYEALDVGASLGENVEYDWTYCRYFWEAEVIM